MTVDIFTTKDLNVPEEEKGEENGETPGQDS
jgi:hypothetical protein